MPTPMSLATLLDMAKLTSKDIHYDLGSGDGRTVIAAAKRGAQAVGVEYNPELVPSPNGLRRKKGPGKAKFITATSSIRLQPRDGVTLYCCPASRQIAPPILKMKPGTRVVSPLTWMTGRRTRPIVGRAPRHLWIVPAEIRRQVADSRGEFHAHAEIPGGQR